MPLAPGTTTGWSRLSRIFFYDPIISLGAARGKALAARPLCQEQPFTRSRYFYGDSCEGDKTIGSADWHLAITLLLAVFAIAGNALMITFDRHSTHRIADLLGRLK